MAGKSLTIKFVIDNAQARAANRQVMADFAAQSRAADATANAVDRGAKRGAASTAAASKSQFVSLEKVMLSHTNFIDRVSRKQDAANAKAAGGAKKTDGTILGSVRSRMSSVEQIENKWLVDDYKRRTRREQNAIATDAAEVKRNKKKVETLESIESQFIAADYKRRVKAEQAKIAADAADTKRQEKKAEADAKRDQKKADSVIRKAEKTQTSLERMENAYVMKAYRADRAKERQLEKAAAKEIALANKVALHRVDAALRAAKAERSHRTESGQAIDQLINKVGGIAAAYIGLQAAIGTYRTIVDITNEAAAAARNHAMETLKVRDSLRELAAIKGKSTPDDEELRRYSNARKSSGLTHDEQTTFSTEIYNALGTVSEAKFSKEEREALTTQGARIASRRGGGVEGAKARAGILGILPNFLQGDNGKPLQAEKVAAYGEKAEDIISLGNFAPTQGTQQYQKLLSQSTSEGLMGKFHNPLQAAALASVASKFGAGEAAQHSVEAFRAVGGLAKFRSGVGALETQADYLKGVGVTEEMDPVQQMTKVFEDLKKNAKGRNASIYLQEHGMRNSTETDALQMFFEQYMNGTFQEFLGKAEEKVDRKLPEKRFKEFAASKTGRNRLANAEKDAAVIEAGKEEENLEIARTRGEAIAIEKKYDQSFKTKMSIRLRGVVAGSQDAAWSHFYEELGNNQRRKELGVKEEAEPLALRALRNSSLLAGPIGPLMAPAIKSWTGMNQQEADRLENEAKAQGITGTGGLGGNGGVGPVVNHLAAMNNNIAKMAKPAAAVPRPQGRVPGQPRRP